MKQYKVWIDGLLFPVAPSEINEKIVSKNKVKSLLNGFDYNNLKEAGLTEFDFELLLPNVEYAFAQYQNGFTNAQTYLDKLAELKESKKSFKLVITKMGTGAKVKKYVSLESYTIKDSASNGLDITVSVVMKEFIKAGTKVYKEKKKTQKNRSETKSKISKNGIHWIVKSGDSLWYIAKMCYGDGSRYKEIYEANKDLIDGRNKGQNTTKYTIYAGQDLFVPNGDLSTVKNNISNNPVPSNQTTSSMTAVGITHKVVSDDTIYTLATKYLGADYEYIKIYSVNQELIDNRNSEAIASHNRTDQQHQWYSTNDLPQGKFTIWPNTILTIPYKK